MAVTALPRARTRVPLRAAALAPGVLVLTLIAPAIDLLAVVQPGVLVPGLSLVATALAAAAVGLTWARYPRTSWLAAASLAGCAGLGLRVVGADVAPALSLLAIVALGIGGAFASPPPSAEAWLS